MENIEAVISESSPQLARSKNDSHRMSRLPSTMKTSAERAHTDVVLP